MKKRNYLIIKMADKIYSQTLIRDPFQKKIKSVNYLSYPQMMRLKKHILQIRDFIN